MKLLLASLALASSCAPPGPATSGPASSSSATSTAAVEPTSSRAAQRVVAASATAADLVTVLLPRERVAGLPEQAFDYSRVHDDPTWKDSPRFSSYQAETVLSLHPDLVVACPYQSRDTSSALRAAHIDVFELPQIDDVAGARAALLALGAKLGAAEEAARVVADLDRRVSELEVHSGARRGVKAMCYSNFGAQGWTAGSKTTIHEMMRLAGLDNVVAEHGREGHTTISFEELIQYDPELILVGEPLTHLASDSAGDPGGASQTLLESEPMLKNLRAVREHRIVALPAWLFATGSQEIVTGAETLARRVDAVRASRDAKSGEGQ